MSEHQESSATRQRFIRIGKRRTSVRLEESLWQALRDIAAAEETDIHGLCTRLYASRGKGTYTSALRIFIVDWMRQQAVADRSSQVSPGD